MNQPSTDAQSDGSKRRIVLVSGMHRSGTSAFTRVCNLLGGALPQPLVEPAVGNELGHWEPAAVVAMNDRALLGAGSDVNAVAPLSAVWLRSAAARQFTDEVESYVAGLGDGPQTWFIKDPRISLLAGLWRTGVERTGIEPSVVIAFRNPWEVAASLTARQLRYFPDEVWPLERGLALWLNYILAIERKSRGLRRSFISYEGLLGDWPDEIARVYDQLGLPSPVLDHAAKAAVGAFLKPEERHARHDAMQTRAGLPMRVYALLQERLADPHGGKAAFDKAAQAFTGSFDLLGGYVDALEARASQLGPLKALAASAETVADQFRRAVETNELRMVHLTRSAASAHPEHSENRPGAFADAGQGDALALLKMKHDALVAAHRENLLAFKAEQSAWSRDRDQLIERKAAELTDAIEVEQAVWRSERHRLIESQRAEMASLSARKDTEISTLNASLQKQEQEVRDGRDAYEELRLEAADLRGHLQARGLAGRLFKRDGAEAESLDQALASTRAELALIRASRSWRITAPLRAVLTTLGRR